VNPLRLFGSAWTSFVEAAGFLRKELAEIVRQPRLLVVLILGPFLVLLLFGLGYKDERVRLRTLFVGPPGSVYEQAVDRYAEQLADYVEPRGFTSDLAAADRELEAGNVDVVVTFPTDPVGRVLAGERAVIVVLHDELNPIQRAAVEIASRLAVQELNAAILTNVVSSAQAESGGLQSVVDTAAGHLDEVEAALARADAAGVATSSDQLGQDLDQLDALASASVAILSDLDPSQREQRSADLATMRENIAAVRQNAAAADDDLSAAATQAKSGELRRAFTALQDHAATFETLKPEVLVQPFAPDTESVLPERVNDTDFFTPSSIALLVQHLAVTFASLSLVRDRSLGLYEVLRIGPLGAGEILAGKYVAYVLLGSVVGAALTATAVFGLGVPFQGSIPWAAGAVLLVLTASLGLGIVISQLSRSESQAVQFAMLTLLAGMFFGGFTLDLDALEYPVKAISWLIPVTYGIRMLQDVMLRGVDPSTTDLVGSGALVVGFGVLAVLLFRRQLRLA
jgi:ABC-2 type transport system permease protein